MLKLYFCISHSFLLLLLILSSFPLYNGEERTSTLIYEKNSVDSNHPKTKYAWVSFLYGTTYFWPLRVMQSSLRKHNTVYDIVTLVDQDVTVEYRKILMKDGTRVLDIPSTIKNPYQDEKIYQNRFGAVMSKLNMFNLVEYEKIVYLDADTMMLKNSDELFNCGDFCAVFINPCIFNSGVMVISPSTKLFQDMISKVAELPSYDGADQGFLNSYFNDLLSSPLWNPLISPHQTKNNSLSDDNPNEVIGRWTGNFRLPTFYHVDHFLYYQRGKWDMPCLTPKILEFMGPAFMKPWNWWTYSVMDLSWMWLEEKESLSNSHEFAPFFFNILFTLIFLLFCRFLSQSQMKYQLAQVLQRKKRTEGVQVMQSLCIGFIILSLSILFTFFILIDPSTHPNYAFFIFFLWMHGVVPTLYYGWLLMFLAPIQLKGNNQKITPSAITSKELVVRTIMLATIPFLVLLFCTFMYKSLGLVFLFHKIAFLIFGALMQIFSFFFFFGMSASFWMQAYAQESVAIKE
eukprot:TRINITY_DN4040_c0_g1_i1.p1 TRINITY_DN4040_c0_g1~~TRINITY_DN4040_c0_g1_i1.p1  ORF type:complete len:515 (+),score=88.39 TRINITY_DN4040_c0_g1_i1:235-1779(+)